MRNPKHLIAYTANTTNTFENQKTWTPTQTESILMPPATENKHKHTDRKLNCKVTQTTRTANQTTINLMTHDLSPTNFQNAQTDNLGRPRSPNARLTGERKLHPVELENWQALKNKQTYNVKSGTPNLTIHTVSVLFLFGRPELKLRKPCSLRLLKPRAL